MTYLTLTLKPTLRLGHSDMKKVFIVEKKKKNHILEQDIFNSFDIFWRVSVQNGGLVRGLKAYKRYQVLHALSDDVFGHLIWPMFVSFNVWIHGLFIYITVKMRNLKYPILVFFGGWSINFLVLELVVYTLQGLVFVESSNLIWAFKKASLQKGHRGQGVSGKRVVDAIIPSKVSVGGIFVMKRSTALTVIYLISTVTCNCLLLF